MQLIISFSKFLLLVILTCSLLVTWNYNIPDFVRFSAINNTERNVNVLPAESKSIWHSMRHEFTLDHQVQSARVQHEIRRLLADQKRLYNILKAAGPYIYFILNQTKSRGLPAELALIPVIESEFNPYDRSTKGATGLWQLMPQTAHDLGVKVHSGYDGRRNVVDSTKAALAYFNDLGTNFNGNWLLAIAAYNCGQYRVESAERRSGSHSFWNLRLPTETKYYVPRLLAVAAIVQNPEKYGISLPPINDEPYFAEVKVDKPVNLDQVAKSSGINPKTLDTLNPDYHRTSMVKKKDGYSLLVPVRHVTLVKAKLGQHVIKAKA